MIMHEDYDYEKTKERFMDGNNWTTPVKGIVVLEVEDDYQYEIHYKECHLYDIKYDIHKDAPCNLYVAYMEPNFDGTGRETFRRELLNENESFINCMIFALKDYDKEMRRLLKKSK